MGAKSKALVICVKNEGYAVSLERRKLYVTLADAQAAKRRQLRVIDESERVICTHKSSSWRSSCRSHCADACYKRPNPVWNADRLTYTFRRKSVSVEHLS